MSILRTAAVSEKYRTLLAVMKATDLEELLDHSGPFTVFAPSDHAFEKFSRSSNDDLMHPDHKKELKALLTYHIVAGKLSASKILKALSRGKGKTTFTTLQGDSITATMKGIDIILSDSFGNTATIVVADSNQRNGIIHEIDAVIRPKKL
ncbi:fasciclin domain-containing protein [Pricia sp.]|uniref:fasciclin domain-containing protein n=1 Tax=Pricia sp. TaxID=2268138 RepID=UPI00359486CA